MNSRTRFPGAGDAEGPAVGQGNSRRHRGDQLKFFTMAAVAEHLDVHPRTVKRWIDDELLVAHKIVGVVRIAEDDLRAFLAAHRDH